MDANEASEMEPLEHVKQLDDRLTFSVIGAAQRVHAILGPGFTEAVYELALRKELSLRQVPFVSQQEFDVFYEGTLCGRYRTDMIVDKKVVVELKAVDKLAPEHKAQLVSYLKASGLMIGLLLNFGAVSLGVRRYTRTKLI